MPEPRARRSLTPFMLTDLVQPLPPATRYILRGSDPVRATAESAFGVHIPAAACRAVSKDVRAALWLGPDEWLLLAPEAQADCVAVALESALRNLPHSLVDVSHRQVAFSISGQLAATLLNSGCPLDLDPRAFPVDMCTRTVLAKAEVVLWRMAVDTFRLEVWRSYAEYLALFLAEAARGMPAMASPMSQ